MKKVLLLLALSTLCYSGFAQSTTAATYALSTLSGTYTSVAGGTTVASLAVDDASQTNIPIGFTFRYCGTNYTQLAPSSNGYVSLANATAATAAISYQNTVGDLGNIGAGVGMLMVLWDDLQGSAAGATSSACTGVVARYATTGTAPNRVFTFEWFNYGLYLYSAAYSGCGSFELKLYETSNQIDFCYGTSNFAGNSATIGIANSGADHKILSTNVAFPAWSTTVFTTTLVGAPPNGTIYRWCPQNITTTASNTSPICSGLTANLTGTTTGSGLTYSWTGPNSFTSTLQSPTIPLVTVAATGTYTFTASIGTCSANDTTQLTVNQTPSAILGGNAVCMGSTLPLTDGTAGGTWTSGTAAVATISAGGVVTPVSAGTSIITYKIAATGCDTTETLTVNALPVVAAITNGGNVCVGSTRTLADVTPAGVWSSTNPAIATVSAGGVVTGVTAGTTTISYTVTSAAGCIRAVTSNVTVAAPAATITGNPLVCVGATSSLADATAGGTWSSSTPAVATVSAAGVVTGASGGNTIVTYSVTNTCGTTTDTMLITVSTAPPSVGTISGPTHVCIGSTITLLDATPGGVWSSSSVSNATVDALGDVTGVSAGALLLSYTVTNGCGTTSALYLDTVIALPTAGLIVGSTNICLGTPVTLTDATSGGSWTTSNAAVATVNASGVVTPVTVGTATISYTVATVCGTAFSTADVTVIAIPVAGTISGAATVCETVSTSLSETVAGGTWTSSSPANATVDAAGNVTGVLAGSVTITYTFTNFCGTATTTFPMTVLPAPNAGVISGSSTVCESATTTLNETVATGGWSSSSPLNATIGPAGNVTGLVAGSVTMSYTVNNSCGTATALFPMTVLPAPNAGTISGSVTVCEGVSTPMSETVVGGTWSSSSPANATVDASGNVLGVLAGSVTITYTFANSCGSVFTTFPMTVLPAANAGTISGAATVCEGVSTSLNETVAGGTWSSSSPSNATVNASGNVTGVLAGATTISYTFSNSCGIATATFPMTVLPAPNAGVISGATIVCQGTSTLLNETVVGGTWSSGNPAIASVDAAGNVTGIASGAVTISYQFTNSCGTATATYPINITPSASAGTISGVSSVCPGFTTSLSSTVGGGSWVSSDNTVATINASGVVTGVNVAGGTATMTYTVTNSCGTATTSYTITVNPNPDAGVISGLNTTCVGSPVTLSSTIAGGNWSSSNLAAATVGVAGDVTPVASGATTISYSFTNSCGTAVATYPFTVLDVPPSGTISGASSICQLATATLTESTPLGTWSSSDVTIATISASTGIVNGVMPGSVTITYTNSNTCGTTTTTTPFTVNAAPNAGTITGPTAFCLGNSITIADAAIGGSWSSANTAIATIDASGVVLGVTSGTTNMIYTVTNGCGTATATVAVNVLVPPTAGTITGAAITCVGNLAFLSNVITGGVWSSSDVTIATIDPALGTVTGVGAGSATITYTVNNICGTAFTTTSFTVLPTPSAGSISGATNVCPGLTTTLTDAAGGGTWSSSSVANATIGSTTGIVTGVAAGTVTFTYSVPYGCGSVTTTYTMTVDPAPSAAVISGTASTCPGTSVTLSDAIAGGGWSNADASIASIDASGVVTGHISGTTTITYTTFSSCGINFNTYTFTVLPGATGGTILGTTNICSGSATTLTDAASGGFWASSNPGVATISATGVMTGTGAGTATISYTATNSCGTATTTIPVTVDVFPVAGVINGTTTVCPGTSSTLTDTAIGGVWSSAVPSVATITAGGVVTGVALGTSNVYYTVTNACGTTNVTVAINVTSYPSAGTISGSTSVCLSGNTILSDGVSGGVWSSSNNSVATVDAFGNVFGVAGGSATISYTVASSCGTASATQPMTTVVVPDAGVVLGTTAICQGATSTLTDAIPGGVWSSTDTTIAMVSSTGVVTGTGGGSVIINYSVTTSCGTGVANTFMTISPLPIVGTITGSSNVCQSSVTTLTSSAAGGTWSSSAPTIAPISTSGVVAGVSTGSAVITYSATNSCGTSMTTHAIAVVTLPTTPGTISGPSIVCAGGTSSLTETISGGSWTSSDASLATVDTFGVVTGIAGGAVTITYTVGNSCGSMYTTSNITVTTSGAAGTILGGTTAVCEGGTITLTDAAPGGTWSSSNPGFATIDPSTGIVTGVSFGAVTMSYTVATSCGSSSATTTVNISPTTALSPIVGPALLCTGSSYTLTNATFGGVWSSSDPSVLVIDAATGALTIGSVGTATVSYTYTNVFGCVSMVSSNDTVNMAPNAGTITATTTTVCAGSTISLTESSSTGSWSSSDPTIATVDASGLVTGVATGSASISYTATNICGTASTSVLVNVLTSPALGPVVGPTGICNGVSATFSDVVFTGTWSTSDASVATINASGVLTTFSAGNVTISYSQTNAFGCTTTVSQADTVFPAVTAGSITATTTTLCQGATTTLSESAVGGTWSSSDVTVLTVDASGVVTAVGPGSANVTYAVVNSYGCSASTFASFVVNPTPTTATLGGTTSVCVGATSTLTSSVMGGVWTSSNVGVATIAFATGVQTGVSAGIVTMTYTQTNVFSCTSVATIADTVSVTPSISGISGAAALCAGTTLPLTETTTGGTWSSDNTAVATVDATGLVSGVSAGSAVITYTVGTLGCNVSDTQAETVNPAAVSTPVSGSATVCAGATTSLTNTTSGGTWSSSNTAVATVSATGVVTGVSAGTVSITYTIMNAFGCTVDVPFSMTVNPAPAITANTGATDMCNGSSITLSNTTSGGSWSSSVPSVAIVDPTGVVSGITVGTTMISYTVTNSFGCSASAVTSDTVSATPIVNAISGAAGTCAGTNATLTETTAGGIWSSSNATIAPITAGGVVTGLTAGTVAITYTVFNGTGCSNNATASFAVYPTPLVSSITGGSTACVGTTTSLSDAAPGGSWSSTNTGVATVSATGIVTGVAVGTTQIVYSVTSSTGCPGTAMETLTVSTAPTVTAISGSADVCPGSTTAMTESTAGGTWSSSNTAIATVDPASGLVTGVTPGSATISYTVSGTGCSVSATFAETVDTPPSVGAIAAASTMCVSSTVTATDATAGGTWSSSNTAVATVGASTGIINTLALGTTTLSYSISSAAGCVSTATLAITVDTGSVTGTLLPLSGSLTLCHGASVNLSVTSSTTGLSYQWYNFGVMIPGATTASYTTDTVGMYSVHISSGSCGAMLSGVTVSPSPTPIVHQGAGDILYTGSFVTYQWLYNGSAIPGATNSIYHQSANGSYQVVVTDANGCTSTSAVFFVTTAPNAVANITAQDINLYPNPATSVININAPIPVSVSVRGIDGKLIFEEKNAKSIDVSSLPPGMYMIQVFSNDNILIKNDKFIKE